MTGKRLVLALPMVLLLTACAGDTVAEESVTTTTSTADSSVTSEPDATTTRAAVTPTTVQPTTTIAVASTTTEAEAEPTALITVANGNVDGGGLIEVTEGEEVQIQVISDTVDMAHLHGYDIAADVGPDLVGTIEFVADIPGLFELELEESGLELGRLQVSP